MVDSSNTTLKGVSEKTYREGMGLKKQRSQHEDGVVFDCAMA